MEDNIFSYEDEYKKMNDIAVAIGVVWVLLLLAALIHSAVYLSKSVSNKDGKEAIRGVFVAISIIFGPLYWIIFPIAYLAGSFKK